MCFYVQQQVDQILCIYCCNFRSINIRASKTVDTEDIIQILTMKESVKWREILTKHDSCCVYSNNMQF